MNDAPTQLKAYEPREVHVLENEQQLFGARFSPCGKFLAVGGFDGRLHRWNVADEEPAPLVPLEGHRGWPAALAFHPDQQRLFSADSWGRICCWPYAEDRPQTAWAVEQAHTGWIRDLAVSPDGRQLASCGTDGGIRLWATADGAAQQQWTDEGADVYCVRFHPDGKSLLTGDLQGIAKQWDLEAGTCLREFDASALYLYSRIQDVGGIRCLACTDDGTKLACGGAQPKNGGNVTGIPTIFVFDLQTGERTHTLELGTTNDVYVCDLLWHPAGFLMAVTSGTPGSGKLLYQRPEDKEPFFVETKLANCHGLSLHPQGRRLAVTATNRSSAGNGRQLDKEGRYRGNSSPIHLFALNEEAAGGE